MTEKLTIGGLTLLVFPVELLLNDKPGYRQNEVFQSYINDRQITGFVEDLLKDMNESKEFIKLATYMLANIADDVLREYLTLDDSSIKYCGSSESLLYYEITLNLELGKAMDSFYDTCWRDEFTDK